MKNSNYEVPLGAVLLIFCYLVRFIHKHSTDFKSFRFQYIVATRSLF
jgi:hypothetical protein